MERRSFVKCAAKLDTSFMFFTLGLKGVVSSMASTRSKSTPRNHEWLLISDTPSCEASCAATLEPRRCAGFRARSPRSSESASGETSLGTSSSLVRSFSYAIRVFLL